MGGQGGIKNKSRIENGNLGLPRKFQIKVKNQEQGEKLGSKRKSLALPRKSRIKAKIPD